MFFLRVDIVSQRFEVRRADRKCAISFLPREVCKGGRLGLEPLGRRCLEVSNQIRKSNRAGQAQGDMNMIRDPTDPKTFAVCVTSDGCQICVQVRGHSWGEQGARSLVEKMTWTSRKASDCGMWAQCKAWARLGRTFSPQVYGLSGTQGFTLGWDSVRPWRLFLRLFLYSKVRSHVLRHRLVRFPA